MPADKQRSSIHGMQPSDKYFLSGGDLHIMVGNVEFLVHRHFFERESEMFKSVIASSPAPGEIRKGSSRLNPIKLEDATVEEFETFLWVFYNPRYSIYDATIEEWSTILRLGHEWGFAEVQKLAVRELEKHPHSKSLTSIDRIVLYRRHGVPEDVLVPYYAAICARGTPLEYEECQKLGMKPVVAINQALHALAYKCDEKMAPLVSKIVAHSNQTSLPVLSPRLKGVNMNGFGRGSA